jgi:WD repeat-containing protein 19
VLTVATRNGFAHSYLASLPVIYDIFATKVAYLTSLLEVSVVDIAKRCASTHGASLCALHSASASE